MIEQRKSGDLLQYTNLTFDEISAKIEQHKLQISELISLSDPSTVKYSPGDSNTLFQQAASCGNITKLKSMLSDSETKPHLDINAGDTPPLIYAACFGQLEITELLLEAGADINVHDSFGCSALTWAMNNQHQSIVKLLLDKDAIVSDCCNDFDEMQVPEIIVTDSSDNSCVSSLFHKLSSSSLSSHTVLDFETHPLNTVYKFHWDKCTYDQMFVYDEDNLDYILELIITQFKLPISDLDEMFIPANVIFLAARYCYYFSEFEMLDNLLTGSFKKIRKMLCLGVPTVHFLAFWISNLNQLLFYLKKDTSLVFATMEQQLSLSELMSELYSALVQNSEKRLFQMINPAILEYEPIPDIGNVQFKDSWQRLFFPKNARISIMRPVSNELSPQSITKLFSEIIHMLRAYQVHTNIITQLFSQIIHFISCESFNRIIQSKTYICRSKAMQIRMNISQLEDWISDHSFFTTTTQYLSPIIQLLQFLQCLTQLEGLLDFIQVTQKFDTLTMSQIRRCILSYRYEIKEDKIPEEIEKYTIQCAQDKVRQKSFEAVSSGRPRLSFFGRNSSMLSISEQLPDEESKETKHTKLMLSFTVPTLTQAPYENHSTPSISPEWIIKLGKTKNTAD